MIFFLFNQIKSTRLMFNFLVISEHEPDLIVISRQFPVPNNPMTREIQIVLETIQQGPRARMPVHWAGELLPAPAPAHEVPALAAVEDRNAVGSNEVGASMNSYGTGGAMTLHALQAHNNAAAVPPNYLGPISNHTNQNATTGNSQNTQNGGFLAGYRAATQYYANSMNGMLNFPLVPTPDALPGNGMPGALGSHMQLLPMQSGGGIPGHTMPGSAALSAQMSSQANAEYIQLMQMHMAAQGNMCGMGVASVNHAPARNQNRSLTFEQLQAYQTGTWTPSMPPRQDGGN